MSMKPCNTPPEKSEEASSQEATYLENLLSWVLRRKAVFKLLITLLVYFGVWDGFLEALIKFFKSRKATEPE